MAPERLEMPWLADPRIDIFSVGAVAHFLLAGKTPILGANASALMAGLSQTNEYLASLKGNRAFMDLVLLIASCFSPEASQRPGAIHVVMESLDQIAIKFPWSEYDADAWWSANGRKMISSAKRRRIRNPAFQTQELDNEPIITHNTTVQ